MSESLQRDEATSEGNIKTTTSMVFEYSREVETTATSYAAGLQTTQDPRCEVGAETRAAKLFPSSECSSLRRPSGENTMEHSTILSKTRSTLHHRALIPEEALEIQCGEKTALLFVSKLCQGSKGPCILYNNEWLTPNELQYICGRETAKDWKRSIRHKGKSLKSLIAQGFLKVHPPICDCPGCRVSSPVNRTRLADKCGFSKIPSYLADKSMAESFPTMWRRSSTSSDELDKASIPQRSENADDDSQPQRSHSDEPRYYRTVDDVSVAKRPRSSSPDLDRGRVNVKRRCLSETNVDKDFNAPTASEITKSTSSTVDVISKDRKSDVIDVDLKSRELLDGNTIRGPLRRGDLPMLSLPTSAYAANVFYAHNQAPMDLHRHVTSPRLLSPSFVRPSVNSPTVQIRLLQEQGVPHLPSQIFAQQLRHDFANVGMATMFPYSFTHPLPGNQLLTPPFKKLTPDIDRRASAGVEMGEGSLTLDERQGKGNGENEQNKADSSSPCSDPLSSPKQESLDKSRSSSTENFKFCNDEGSSEEQTNTRTYSNFSSIAAHWSVDEVCKFVSSVTGCNEYCDAFQEQEIDGQALILLTEDHLSNKMGLKLGPALKLKSKIDELRCVYTK